MKRLTCEMCGGTDLIKDGGVFVCQSCGCKYTVEEARKMMIEGTVEVTGTVRVDNSAAVENYLKMARNALEAGNHEEAEIYANRIIEIDPQSSPAWEIKGEAAGWQSRANNNRVGEAVTAWLNAIQFAPAEEKDAVRARVADKYVRLFAAMVSLRTGNFAKLQTNENLKSALGDVDGGIDMMNNLTVRGGVSFNRANIYNVIARSMNSGAVDGYKDAQSDFGPEHHKMAKWQWENFTRSCDNCVKLLDRASELARSNSLGKTICGNMVTIAEDARDSCSWKFNVNSWSADHYDVDYSFTTEAKKARTKSIDGYKKKKETFETDQRARVMESVQAVRRDAEIALAHRQYWEAHAAEQRQLELERQTLLADQDAICAQLASLPVIVQLEDLAGQRQNLLNRIDAVTREMNSLGVFRSKEKKALQAQLDELTNWKASYDANIADLEAQAAPQRRPLDERYAFNCSRLDAIREELSRERGQVSVRGQYAIPDAVRDGIFTVTPRALFEHLNRVLPTPYRIEELKPQACQLHGDMAGAYGMIVVDPTLPDKNKNTGVVIFADAPGEDEPLRSVVVQTGSDRAAEPIRKFVVIGSYVLMSLSPETTQANAEAALCNLIYSDSDALYSEGALSIEAVSYSMNLMGLVTLQYQGALIRAGH